MTLENQDKDNGGLPRKTIHGIEYKSCHGQCNDTFIIVDGVNLGINESFYFEEDTWQCTKCMDNCDACEKKNGTLHCTTAKPKYATNGPDVLLISDKIMNCVESNTLVYIQKDELTDEYYCPMCSDSEFFESETLSCQHCETKTPGCSQCDVDGICTTCVEGMYLNQTINGETYCHIPNIPYCARANEKDHTLCKECYGYSTQYPDIFEVAPLA